MIKPKNDPGFLGMSVARMCETDSGAWTCPTRPTGQNRLSHASISCGGDKGKSWTLLPGVRPDGWFSPKFSRMDEGRPISLGNNEVYFMAHTQRSNLESHSTDDGVVVGSKGLALVHPDAPPMVFHLSDGKTRTPFPQPPHQHAVR